MATECAANNSRMLNQEVILHNMASEFREDPDDAAVSSGHFMEDTVTPPVQINGDCGGTSVFGVKRSLRKRSGIDYCLFEYSSEEELDLEKPIKTRASKHSRQANDFHGSSNSSEYEEVTARWCPKISCRPLIDDAPVFYPSEEEFRDTLGYIARIRPEAEKYGICRIVPPPSWKPPCPLKEKNMWEQATFSTTIQQVDKLQNREPMRKRSRNLCQRKKKRTKRLRFGMSRCNNLNASEANDCSSDTEEKFGFQSGSDFTLKSFQKFADEFKEQYFYMKDANDSASCCKDTGKIWQPSVEEIEGEYWRIVENPSEEVEVLYGADLETGIFGSGFPKENLGTGKEIDPHVFSGWNLNKFPRLPGSVLSFESGDISGVLVPWLYIGMCFSSFCWHVEDHHFYSLNYMHWGDSKIWYGVPGSAAVKLEEAMRKHLPELFEEQPHLLNELVTQLSPSVLKSEGVPVYRAIQKSGEFVLTFPRAYHSGFNCGFNCAEAVNVAPMDWLPHGQCAVELYREQRRKTSISHDKLLFSAAREAVRALWELLLLGLNKPNNLKWQSVCGKDGILTMAISARVEMEAERRESYCNSLKARKMDGDFDCSNERECISCFYDLYLSAASCECSLDRYTCLIHADVICSCDSDRRFVLFRYGMEDLNTLVEALEGDLSALQHWGSCNLGLVPPLNVIEGEHSGCLKPRNEFTSKELTEKGLSSLVFDLSEQSKSASNCAPQVDEATLQIPEIFPMPSVKVELESRSLNSVSMQHTEFICSGTASKKNVNFVADNESKDEIKWFLDLNKEDTEQDCATASIKEEQSLLMVTDDFMTCKPQMEYESMTTANALLRSNPESGSSFLLCNSSDFSSNGFLSRRGCETLSSKGTGSIYPSKPKVFGIDIPHQPLFRANSDSDSNRTLSYQSPICTALKPPSPAREKHSIISKYFVEPLNFGSAIFGKHWCNAKAIFLKGFRSHVRYLSVLDPMTTCSYISEVLDAGLIGPLFKVTVENSPKDTFMHSSPSQCWDLVRGRLNQEIIKQCSLGNQDLPPLQAPGSIDGLEMFGFMSPSIIQVIESLDPLHRCTEYWASKSNSLAAIELKQENPSSCESRRKLFGVEITDPIWDDSALDEEVGQVLGPLFNRSSSEELRMMHRVFRSGSESDYWKAAYRALQNEIEKNVNKYRVEEDRSHRNNVIPNG